MLALLLVPVRPAQAEAPVVSVWYRGTPAGVPRQDDLALLRSLGFTAVSWPADRSAAVPALRRFAQAVGLRVLVEPDEPVAGSGAVVRSGQGVRLRVDRVPATHVSAHAWSALARGAGVVSFDAGAADGHGVADPAGAERPWVRPALSFARQVMANAVLFEGMAPGPPPLLESAAASGGVVSLFAAPRTWVLIVTHTGQAVRTLTARFAPGVPYAIWTSLLDGSTMSMLSDPGGPQIALQLAPGEVAVYFADRGGP